MLQANMALASRLEDITVKEVKEDGESTQLAKGNEGGMPPVGCSQAWLPTTPSWLPGNATPSCGMSYICNHTLKTVRNVDLLSHVHRPMLRVSMDNICEDALEYYPPKLHGLVRCQEGGLARCQEGGLGITNTQKV